MRAPKATCFPGLDGLERPIAPHTARAFAATLKANISAGVFTRICGVAAGLVLGWIAGWQAAFAWLVCNLAMQVAASAWERTWTRRLADGVTPARRVIFEASGLTFLSSTSWAGLAAICWFVDHPAAKLLALLTAAGVAVYVVINQRRWWVTLVSASAPVILVLIGFGVLAWGHFGDSAVLVGVLTVILAVGHVARDQFVAEQQSEAARDAAEEAAALARAKEQRWAVASRTSGAGLWWLDLRTRAFDVSDEVAALVGFPREHIAGLPLGLFTFIPEPWRAQCQEKFRAATRGELSFDVEHPFDTAAGGRLWIRSVIGVERDARGAATGLVGTITDLTARKAAEERAETARREAEAAREALAETLHELQLQQRRWEMVLKAGGGAFHEYDLRQQRYTQVAGRFEEMTGLTLERLQAEGNTLRPYVPEPYLSQIRERMESSLSKGEAYEFEHPIDRPDGQRVWVDSTIITERDQSGDRIREIGLFIDITTKKAAEAHLMAAEQAARDASRAKSEFLAAMSHEIRTPMNGVLGMAELLAREDLSPTARDHVRTLRHSGRLLLTILNDLLDLSKIEAGKMEVERLPMNIDKVVGQLTKLWAPRAEEKGLSFSTTIDPSMPRMVLGDPTRLQQILFNLVSNAVKFTSHGAITLLVGAQRRADAQLELRIAVSDTGEGIDAAGMEKLFRPFTQADATTSRRHGGTGLGLTISKRLAEAMGGSIEVCSTPGKGSTFTLIIETQEAAPDSGARLQGDVDAESDATRGLRILLAEDNPVNQRIAIALLSPAGHAIDVVDNGAMALEAASKSVFDLILMDVQMPVLDGLEATVRLRAQDGPNRTTPVVGLTADAFEEQRQKAFAAGMTDYVTKPIDPRALHAAIARATAQRQVAA